MRITNQIIRTASYCSMLAGLFLFISCSGSATADSGSSIMDKTKDMAGDMKDGASKMAGDMKDMSGDAMDKMKEGAEAIGDGAKNMADGTKKMAGDMKDGAGKMAGDMKDGAGKIAGDMKDGAGKIAGDMKDGAGKMASKMKDGADSGMSKAKSMASNGKEAVAMQTKNMADKGKAMTTSATQPTKSTSQPATKMEKKMDKMDKKMDKMEEKKDKMMAEGKSAMVGVSHEPFDKLLKAHVSSSGVVDYAGMKSDMSKLNSYIATLAANPAQSSWPRDAQLAYWINAYNAHTIKLILDNYPVSSIKDINGGKPWDKSWIKLGGKTYSLNNIENDIIRPTFKEPRIHFAVNCAAKSCPPLHNGAWTAENLESNLEASSKKFINDSNHNQISASSAKISSIFDWYAVDFGDVKTFLNKYSNTKVNSSANVSYIDYNWSLNGK